MNGYTNNLNQLALSNDNFREVLYTAKSCQLVLMNLKPKEEIGEETHDLDQFFYFVSGNGDVLIDDKPTSVSEGSGVIVPAGAKHNVINTSENDDLKLFTVYSPPEHKDKVVHSSKEIADDNEEHFDGKTTE